jgi:hypothetical protein
VDVRDYGRGTEIFPAEPEADGLILIQRSLESAFATGENGWHFLEAIQLRDEMATAWCVIRVTCRKCRSDGEKQLVKGFLLRIAPWSYLLLGSIEGGGRKCTIQILEKTGCSELFESWPKVCNPRYGVSEGSLENDGRVVSRGTGLYSVQSSRT